MLDIRSSERRGYAARTFIMASEGAGSRIERFGKSRRKLQAQANYFDL